VTVSRGVVIRRIGVVAIAVVAAAIIVVASSGGSRHELFAIVDEASYIGPGTKVVVAGNRVGRVKAADVTRDGRAKLTLEITDAKAWPLPRTTRMRIRWLSTISFAGRYVELEPPPSGPPLSEGGRLMSVQDAAPVEFDDVLKTFDAPTRARLRSTLRTAGSALGRAGAPLHRALGVAPRTVGEARAVMADLGSDPGTLDTLVRATDRVLAGVQRSDPALSQLIDGAEGTFAVTASRHRELSRVLDEAAPTLDDARQTLARADGTLRLAGELTSRIAGGSRELRRLAPPLTRVLGTVDDVGPSATQTLRALQRAAPTLNPFLARLRLLAPRLESVSREAAKQLNCVRPYAPEAAGLASTWSGFEIQGDKTDKYARIATPSSPWDVLPTSAAQAKRLFPSLRFAFPRPPGEVAGQPWFIPECGVGPESVDPSKDPEAP